MPTSFTLRDNISRSSRCRFLSALAWLRFPRESPPPVDEPAPPVSVLEFLLCSFADDEGIKNLVSFCGNRESAVSSTVVLVVVPVIATALLGSPLAPRTNVLRTKEGKPAVFPPFPVATTACNEMGIFRCNSLVFLRTSTYILRHDAHR